jgi:UDP-N-acetylmuramoylalanine--D-glutamate ligase
MFDLRPLAARYHNKTIAVYGLGKSGFATLAALRVAGISCIASDDDMQKIADAKNAGYTTFQLNDATFKNCATLILAPGIPLYAPAPHPVVIAAQQAGIEIVGDIELMYRAGIPCKTVGVTGTNGKSTTTALITHILNHCSIKAVMAGNIGTAVLDIPTPEKTDVLVLELSSFQLDLCPTFRPDIAVHLNITPDHLDRHGTLARYIAAKESMFNGMGVAIMGVDDNQSRAMIERVKKAGKRRIIPVSCTKSLNQGLSLSGDDLVDTINGFRASLKNLPTLRGTHNYQNAMMAYMVARELGCAPDDIMAAMKTYPGLPHRQLTIRIIGPVAYINDSKATNADATDKALQSFDNIYWIVGGKPKAGGLNGLEPFMSPVRHAFVIGEAADAFATWLTTQNVPFTLCGTLENAVQTAHLLAQSEMIAQGTTGVVLLSPACASYDQFKSYEHRGDSFCQLVAKL